MEKEELKFYLHEYTRQELKNHSRSKKWFTITNKEYIKNLITNGKLPKYIRITKNSGYEIDISSCTYEELIPEIQKIYSDLANVLEFIEDYSSKQKKTYTVNQQAEIIYQNWLSQNPKVNNQKYITTFKELPKGLRDFLKFASATSKKISKAAYRYSFATTPQEILQDVNTYTLKIGHYYCFDFHGCRFYSHLDNADSIHLKLTGLTQSEYEQAVRSAKLHAKISLLEEYNKFFANSTHRKKRDLCISIVELFESGKSDQEIFNELTEKTTRKKISELENKDLIAYLVLLDKTLICTNGPSHKKNANKKFEYYMPYNSTYIERNRQEAKEIAREYEIEK